MKKSIILIGALAVAGLFASCQKENVVTPQQAPEQKVITINPNGFKSDAGIEPLVALGQALNESVNKEDKKDVSLVKEILRDFFRTIANLVGSNETDYPAYRAKYFGSWRAFGAAIAEIQGLSYDARVPYIEFELGRATDLKIGRVEVMPYTDFHFKFDGNFYGEKRQTPGFAEPVLVSGRVQIDSIALVGPPIFSTIYGGHVARRVIYAGSYSGLIVKFEFKHETYAFAICVEGEAGNDIESGEDWISFDVIYGEYDTSYYTLEEWYDAYMYNEYTYGLPIYPSSELYLYSDPTDKECWLYHDGFALEVGTEDYGPEPVAYLNLGYGMYEEDECYYQLRAYSTDPVAAKDFYRDYLWATAFGCDESEGKALIEEYRNTFTDNLYLFGWYYDDSWNQATFGTNLTIGLEAKELRWKPVLGFSYECEDGTVFVPFKEYTANSCYSDEYQSFWDYLAWDTSISDKWINDGWSLSSGGLKPRR